MKKKCAGFFRPQFSVVCILCAFFWVFYFPLSERKNKGNSIRFSLCLEIWMEFFRLYSLTFRMFSFFDSLLFPIFLFLLFIFIEFYLSTLRTTAFIMATTAILMEYFAFSLSGYNFHVFFLHLYARVFE